MKKSQRYVHNSRHLKKQYANWPLKLLRHVHTGKLVHHQHTSYPVVAFLLLVFGVFLWSWTSLASADSLTVSAVVSGPVPTSAATIDSPADASTFDTTPITVRGTCPTSTYVQVFRNSLAGGTALCLSDGTYSLQTDLFVGSNSLIVRDYNYANQAGPDSAPVTVTYTPKATDQSPPDSTTPPTGSDTTPQPTAVPTNEEVNNPLVLKTDYAYKGITSGDVSTWQVNIEGGVAPYSVHVEWGDGQQSLYTVKTASVLSLSHIYKQPGGYKGSYIIKVTSTDSIGAEAFLQILAIVNSTASSLSTGASTGTGGSDTIGKTLEAISHAFIGGKQYVWISYLVCVLMLVSFWLGEVRELRLIRHRVKARL